MTTSDVALIVVHRLVDSRREFLIARRVPEGYWSLVGGLVEDGESEAEGARRELAEETGLADPLGFEHIPLSLGFEGETGWNRLHVFAAEAPPDFSPVLDEEHDDHRWCSVDDALSQLLYDEPRDALRHVAKALEERA